jgi:hypothetical protein
MGKKFGVSFSAKRALGISAMKGKISRAAGIPLTRQGRQRKIGRGAGCLVSIVIFLTGIVLTFKMAFAISSPSTTEQTSPSLQTIFFYAGGIAGLYAFLRLIFGDLSNFFGKPKLKITFDSSHDLKTWTVGPPFLQTFKNRKVATVHIKNKGKRSAQNCEASIEVKAPNGSITSYPLHWADTPYEARSTSIELVDINTLPRRLDVVFTEEGQPLNGCFVASSQSLSTGPQRAQFYLSPGRHKAIIHIHYNNQQKVKKSFTIISSQNWKDLEIKPRRWFL